MIKENSKKEEQITLENKEEVLDIVEEKYNKEIAPILKILKPDDINFDDFEKQTKEELFSDVKKLQISRGEYTSNPEDSIIQAKNLLINRVKSALEDYNNPKNKKEIDSDFIKKCKLVLLVENDDTDIKRDKSLEYYSDFEDISVNNIKNYLTAKYDDKLSESDMEILMETKYKNILINMNYHDFWSSCEREIPESLLLEMIKHNCETAIVYEVLDYAKEKKYSKKLLEELSADKKYYIFKRLNKFESYDVDSVFYISTTNDPKELTEIGKNVYNSDLDLNQKNELYLYIFNKAVALGANNSNFGNFFYNVKNLDEFFTKPEIHDSLIKYISDILVQGYNLSSIFDTNDSIPAEILSKAAEEATKRAIKEEDINGGTIKNILQYLPPEFFMSPEIVSLLETTIMESFTNNKDIVKALDLWKNYKNVLSEEFLNSPQIMDAAKNYIGQNIERISCDYIIPIKKELEIPDEFFHSNEIETKLKNKIVNNLTSGKMSSTEAILAIEAFGYSVDILNTEEITKTFENNIFGYIESLDVGSINTILNNFKFSPEFLNSSKLIETINNKISSSSNLENYRIICSIINRLNFSEKINLKEYTENIFDKLITSLNIEEAKRFVGYFRFLRDDFPASLSTTSVVLEKIINHPSLKDSDKEKVASLKKIEEGFSFKENREGGDKEILEIINKFENNYGSKGKDLVVLAVSVYGTENKERFIKEMEKIEKVLNKYNHDLIPDDAKVSMGIEYEVTKSIADAYSQDNILGYKKSILALSESSNIGRGNDGVHEIATKPNYNPYMLMAEMRLLQEGGFLDLNFELYKNAPRGYHLSLVGNSGLYVNKEMYFLNNIMTMSQLTGIIAGKEINKTKDIYAKNFDKFENSEQKGERCEMKGMATDSVEQFEKAIITAHNAGIAIQMYNKDQNSEVESEKEKSIALEWKKLKEEMEGLIDQHNQFFIDSEFKSGYSVDKDGNYIDTHKHIDTRRNSDLLGEVAVNSENFKNKIQLNKDHLYAFQQPEFVNTLIGINNIFLKNQIEGQNTTVNASNMLNTMKAENYGPILEGKPQESIFENGGKIRDGYYCVQGASEEMITHKSQIILNRFNRNMEKLLNMKEEKVLVEVEKMM